MEPISTTVGAGLIAYASKDLIAKLLGPSAEYIGDEIHGLVRKCNVNLGDIFNKAGRKAGDALEDGSQVNPRVLKAIVNEGSFCDDDTLKEYYAGILTSSRTKQVDDDIGVSLLSELQGMSVYQVRLHYLFYREFYRLYSARPIPLDDVVVPSLSLFMSFNILPSVLGVSEDEFEVGLAHATTGLIKRNLLGPVSTFGDLRQVKPKCKAVEPGIFLEPSLFGIELFIWANGKEKCAPRAFLRSKVIDDAMSRTVVGEAMTTDPDPIR